MARWHSCNVLYVGAEGRHLWQFDARNGGFALNREQAAGAGDALPENLIKKDWRALWQTKLNVAWLPPENVFLRVAQFPQSAFEETRSMVEFQLEKLSPIPVTQCVWTMHVLPHAEGPEQTVILTIAPRSLVEEFLGKLEGQGYLADRLELPMLDQIQAAGVRGDGAWIYPAAFGGRDTALVAWWDHGILRNVDTLVLPPGADRVAALRDQLRQAAWAGELEGWLTAAPEWRLVAEGEAGAEWEPLLRQAVDSRVDVVAPLPPQQVAAATAQRAAQADSTIGFMPPEFAARYKQQFVDRLWMRGLFAVIGLYVVVVAIYLVAVQFMASKTMAAEADVKAQSVSYTNSLQLIAKHDVLLQRKELKFAALDCWLLAAAHLPDTLTLDSLNFSDGKKLGLSGSATPAASADAATFWDDMRKAAIDGKRFFSSDISEGGYRADVQGGMLRWSFSLVLMRSEETP